MPFSHWIEVEDLKARFEAEGWALFDCRFDLTDPEAGRSAYEAGHIPGARFADLDRNLSRPPAPDEGRHPLPDPEKFAAWLGRQGVTRDTQVVAYDAGPGAFAARLWWMLRWIGHADAAVLSGGLASWKAAGGRLVPGTWAGAPADYAFTGADPSLHVTTEDVQAGVADLWDARAPDRFSGKVEPIDPVAGHIPGARNVPFELGLDADGNALAAEVLVDRFRNHWDTATEPPVVMCGSGVTACHLILSLEAAGLRGSKLYVGSWSEWIRDPDRPVAKEGA